MYYNYNPERTLCILIAISYVGSFKKMNNSIADCSNIYKKKRYVYFGYNTNSIYQEILKVNVEI